METKERPNFAVEDKSTLVDQNPIRESFVSTLMKMHGKSEAEANMIFEREARYYKKALFDSKDLKICTGISLYSSFLEIAITGLSIQPGSKSDAFLEARGFKTGKVIDGKEEWNKAARLVISAYGELNMRIAAGQIVRMNNPIVLYEGDHFQPSTTPRGELTVEYKPAIPRSSDQIYGVWCSIILPHNGIDFKWLLKDDIDRLMNYSKPRATDKNKDPKANELYSSNSGQIDPGFLEAKCIKHAMRAYTKMRVSEYLATEGDDDDQPNQDPATFAAPQAQQPTVTVPEDLNEEAPY